MVNRIEPAGDPSQYQSYQILAPMQTHFRPATCEEFKCDATKFGWRSLIDESTDLGQAQAYYIRKQSGRHFKEEKTAEGLTQFEFSAGQPCFAQHQLRIERPAFYFKKDGDYRGNPRGTRPFRFDKAEHWQEDFAEHSDNIRTQLERG